MAIMYLGVEIIPFLSQMFKANFLPPLYAQTSNAKAKPIFPVWAAIAS